jgi:hypothetical protein
MSGISRSRLRGLRSSVAFSFIRLCWQLPLPSNFYFILEFSKKCVQNFCRETEGKRPLGRPSCRWEGNIRVDRREIEWEKCELDVSGSGQRPVAGFCEHGHESWGSIKGGNFLTS